jgi:hypothetical protein
MAKAPTKEDLADLKMAGLMKDLIESPAWRAYSQLLELHIKKKMDQMLLPLHPIMNSNGDYTTMDGVAHVLVGESAKGAIMGLRLALSLPEGIVKGADEIRRKFIPSEVEVSE